MLRRGGRDDVLYPGHEQIPEVPLGTLDLDWMPKILARVINWRCSSGMKPGFSGRSSSVVMVRGHSHSPLRGSVRWRFEIPHELAENPEAAAGTRKGEARSSRAAAT